MSRRLVWEKSLAAAGALAALAASIAWLFVPAYTSVGQGQGGVVHEKSLTVAEENGDFVFLWLILPVLVAALPLLFLLFDRWRHRVTVAVAWLMMAFCFITGFTIGYFYWPSAILLAVAAIVGIPDIKQGAEQTAPT